MSVEVVPKIRVVICPKCRELLPEYPEYNVYKCGGCGTTLQAKKRSVAANSESRTQDADAASRNALNVVCEDKQCSNRKQLVPPRENGLMEKATSSSARECSLDGNVGRGQNGNGECNGGLPGAFNLSDEELENELDIYKLSHRRHRVSNKGRSDKASHSEVEDIGDGNLSLEGAEKESISESDGEDAIQDKSALAAANPEVEITRSDSQRAEDTNNGNLSIEQAEKEWISESTGEYANQDKSALVVADPDVEITRSDSQGAQELDNRNLSIKGAEWELVSRSDGEDANAIREKSAIACANPTVEIIRSDLEEGEELHGGYLLPEGAEEESISGSDTNKDKPALAGASPVVEVTRSDSQGAEELNNGYLSVEGAEWELISRSDGEDANKDKSAFADADPAVEIRETDLGGKELHDGNLSLEEAEEELISGLNGEDANNVKSALVGENLKVEITVSNMAGEDLNNEKLSLEGAEKELNVSSEDGEDANNDQSTLVGGAKPDVDITEGASAIKKSSTDNIVSERGSTSHVTPDKLEEGTSGNPVSSNKQQKKAQRNIHHSADTFAIRELIDPSSELSGVLGELHKSSTTRSSYAYDGSVSSYDGMDERFPRKLSDPFDNTRKVANGVSEGKSRKGKGHANSMSYGDLRRQQQSYLPSGKHHVMKDSRGNQNKLQDTSTRGHSHWMRTKRDEFPSRMPFHQNGYQSHYESGGPSNQMHDELYCSSSFASPDFYEDTEQEKMKLLRMIYKLQDQLSRTRFMSGETNGRLSTGVSYKGKHISAYHSRGLHDRRFSHGVDYPRCNGRCSHEVNWRPRHKFSRIRYSAEAISSAHHVDPSCSCIHCCPQEHYFSADLPPRVLVHNEELYSSYPGQDCCSSQRSDPSSPRWFKTSKLPGYGSETQYGEQRHRAPEVKKYLREKQNRGRRYCKPVAGGAPFITCHKCLKLLQLPADFLLPKRACHQLKCAECSEVLMFSLQNGSHMVSHSSNAIGPTSSHLDDKREVIISSNMPLASHANYCRYTPADPISYSDDYGLSVCKSYSSEGDPVSLTQFLHLHGSEYDNPSVSRPIEPLTEKEKVASRHSSTSKARMGTDESTELSSEMKSQPQPKNSSLHQLMGYSSPSQVIRGTRSYVEGKEPIIN